MSAAQQNTPESVERPQFLEPPYGGWPAEELLAYFHGREEIHYFSVLDETQVSPQKIAGILDYRFEFNGESHRLASGFDWKCNPSTDVEWLILLHKFYYAVGLGRAFHETGETRYRDLWVELTASWIAAVPLDFLPSDVAGRRIQNWIFAYRYFVSLAPVAEIDPQFHLQFLASIREQVDHLCRHLTPARNHRTLELYAIFLAAVVFPELKGARRWRSFAVKELYANSQTDFLADGVHCELSTDYHHIVLRNFLCVKRLATMNGIALPEGLDESIKRALEFSLYVHKPDGLIPSISDGDTGSFLDLLRQGYEFYGDPAMLYGASGGQLGRPPTQTSRSFEASGYTILRSGWGDQGEAYADERYLFFDCGPLGAGNHGHLDLLNIEVAAHGRSLIVDPGRYTYDESGETNWRVLFRGTAYHNTVEVDGKNQTRYAPHIRKFKIQGPEPERELRAFLSRPGFDYVHGIAASHEYPVVHERKILFVAGQYWLICDVLRAGESHDYRLRFHLDALAEAFTETVERSGLLRVDMPKLILLQPTDGETELFLEGGFVSPSYGIKHAAPVVRFTRSGTNRCFYTLLVPYGTERPEVSLEVLPVHRGGEAVDMTAAAALAFTLEWGGEIHRDELFLAHDGEGPYRFAGGETESPFLFRRKDGQGRVLAWHDEHHAYVDRELAS